MAIRVLIVEDSPTARALLVATVESDPEMTVVGQAVDGIEAVRLAKDLRPDVITMDLQLPGIDGFDAIARIMSEAPTRIVVVSASVDARETLVSMQALGAGALTVMKTPVGPSAPDFDRDRQRLCTTLKSMAQVEVVRRWPTRAPVRPAPRRPTQSADVIAIAASTGGPAALYRLLAALRLPRPVPILVTQHIADNFVGGLAEWLCSASSTPVRVAAAGERLSAGTVYLAPDGRHLGLADRNHVALSDGPVRDSFRPSASNMFESVAAVFGRSVAAVMLTGMGADGVDGLHSVREAGGHIVAQDEETSVVYGMPKAAATAGLVHVMLPLGEIAGHLARLVEAPRTVGRTS